MGASAGRILLIPKGDWNADTTYTGLDWVRHNGAAWVCKNTCTNIEPTLENADNWQMMARDGQSGSVIDVDTAMSDTSENPVQNKVIKKYVDEHTPEVDDMTGATADQNGTHGLVPAPQIGDEKKALLGNGTWGSVIIDVDTAMSDTSTNPVQNKVIKSYIDTRTTFDSAMSDTSTNAVQNKVIKSYVDNSIAGITDMTGATATQNGAHGLVPAPQAGDEKKVLLGDGTWGAIDDKFSFSDHDTATSGTSFTDAEDGNMLVTDWTKNLLNPTLETITQYGVTCTNNGDGTYTLNGTQTEPFYLTVCSMPLKANKKYKLTGCQKNGSWGTYSLRFVNENFDIISADLGDGGFYRPSEDITVNILIFIASYDATFNNLVFKPMITTDLNATYDDFVPYDGYEIKSCGKNLIDFLKINFFENNLATYTLNNGILDISCNGIGSSGVYFSMHKIYSYFMHRKLKITFDAKASVGGKFNIGAESIQTFLYDVGTEYERKVLEFEIVSSVNFIIYNASNVSQHLYIKDFMIEIVDEFDGIPTSYESYTGENITVTNTTESPAFGLKSHKGITNIISPGNVKCVYPTNESGKGVLDAMYNNSQLINELSKLKNAIIAMGGTV